MKHLLIASSILAMTAGFAAADTSVKWGGTLMFGIAKNGTDNGGNSDNGPLNGGGFDSTLVDDMYHVYSYIDLIATITGQSDNGLSFGTAIDVEAGPKYTLGDEDGFDDNSSGAFSSPAIFLTGTWGTLTFKSNDIDFYDDNAYNGGGSGSAGQVDASGNPIVGSNTGDFKYEGTWGGFFVGLIADIESGDMSGKTTYSIAGFDLEADYSMDSNPANDSGALWNASAGYTWQTINFFLTADNDTTDNLTEYGVKLGTTIGGIAAWAKYNFHPDAGTTQSYASYDVGASYANGPMSFTVEADNVTEENTTDGIEWTVTGDYTLANGVTAEAGINYTGDVMLGARFAF